MEQARLDQLLSNPDLVGQEDLGVLNTLLDKYPYFQSARLLQLKGLHTSGSVFFEEAARNGAAHLPDRHVIYEITVQPKLRESVQEVETVVQKVHPQPGSGPDLHQEQDLLQLERQVVNEALESTYSLEDLSEPSLAVSSEPVESERSFLEWITGEEEPEAVDNAGIVNAFLAKQPAAKRPTPFFSAVDMGKLSLVEDLSFVTETLAGIYAQQGHIDKARKAFEHLMLKEPQKSAYFAARLKKLEENNE